MNYFDLSSLALALKIFSPVRFPLGRERKREREKERERADTNMCFQALIQQNVVTPKSRKVVNLPFDKNLAEGKPSLQDSRKQACLGCAIEVSIVLVDLPPASEDRNFSLIHLTLMYLSFVLNTSSNQL